MISFVVRGRLQLLQCNSLMALYYPHECARQCSLCNHPTETESHVLNGCTRYQAMYQARHNRLVDVIAKHIPQSETVHVIKDTPLTPRMFGVDSDAFASTASRPDIAVIDYDSREALLVEVAVPFDAFIDLSYSAKFDKYLPLCMEIGSFGFSCRIVVLIFGSLGNVHRRVLPGLRLIGVPACSARWLAKYLSISAIIGSFRVWQKRCADLNV